MKVEAIHGAGPSQAYSPVPLVGSDFKQVQAGVANKHDYHNQLVSLENSILSGKEIKPKELLFHQIKAQQFHMQVELASKTAESMLATVRKLQSPQ